MKTNQRFRTSRRCLSAWRKSARCDIKPRRLILERIEDRLLLAGDFQGGMELQLNGLDGNDSGLIYFQGNSHTAISSSSDDLRASADFTLNHGGVLADVNGVITRHTCNHSPNDGIAAIRLVDGDLSPVNTGNDYIDIGLVYKKSIYSTNNPVIAQDPTGQQPVAKTKEFPAPILRSSIAPINVDGASGRSQMFELAMATGRESKSFAMADSPIRESRLEKAHSPNELNEPARDVSMLAETQSAGESMEASLLESKMTGQQLTKEMLSGAQSEIKLAAAQLENNSADDAGPVRSATHDQLISKTHIRLAKTTFVGSLSHDSQAEQSELGLSGEEHVTYTLPSQQSASSDVSRQIVFTEIGQKDERSMPLPTYLDEKHRTKVVGLAVVAIAGQFLVQKHLHQTASSETCLVPPRRRGSVK